MDAAAAEPAQSSQSQSLQLRLAAVLESTSDFVGISDPAGRLFFINDAGREMIGLEGAAAPAAVTMRDYHPEWACRIISQEGIPAALRNGVWSGETALLSSDGREIPVSQVIIAHSNGRGGIEYLSTIMRDITARKHAEMIQVRLRRQAVLRADVSVALTERDLALGEILQRCVEAMVRHLDAASARIWLLDAQEQRLELAASAGAQADFDGWQARAPVGQLVVGKIAEQRRPHLQRDAVNDPRVGDQEMAAYAGYPLMVEGRPVGVMAIFAHHRLPRLEDDTLDELASIADKIAQGIERKRIEEEFAESLAREREARRAAEEASRLKDEFLAMISHELRAPLTSILGWAQMLRAGSLDASAAERALQTIERNIKTQAHLVSDLFDASRIVTGKLQLDRQPVELLSIVETTVDTVRPLVEEKRQRLQMILEPWVGPFNGDAERLKQVVWNLLTNAIKFTPPGGLIEVRLERLEDKALLIVSDTGQGIDPEFLPYVFDRYRQASERSSPRQAGQTGQTKQKGLGLGLAIVKHLIELHGGAIYPYSRGEGQGTDFMITLPLAVAQPNESGGGYRDLPAEAGAAGQRSSALGGVRVLVVDDEYDTREVLGAMLTRYGAEVRAAGSAAEALQAVIEWRPDVMVSDIGMPEEDGYDLMVKVRALGDKQGGNLPAIALTAYAGTPDRRRALSAGFLLHLAKPVEPVELARFIARAVGRNETAVV
jgi:PAS domain S-box-containing protein